MSVVERARIVRVPTEAQLERALTALLEAPAAPPGLGRRAARVPRPHPRPAPHPTTPARARGRPPARRAPRRRRRRRDADARRPARDRPAHDGPPAPAAPASRRGRGRHGGRGREPMNLGSRVRRAARFDRPQLAAQARRHRPRDAALRGPRRLAGQHHLPGPGARHGRSTSRRARWSPTTSATSTRSGTSRRADVAPAARRGLRGDRRPDQRQARRAAGQRPGRGQRHRSAGDHPRLPAAHDPGRARRGDDQQVPVEVDQGAAPAGHRRRRDDVHAAGSRSPARPRPSARSSRRT